MQKTPKIVAVAAVLIVVGAAIGYAVYASQPPPANSCPASASSSVGPSVDPLFAPAHSTLPGSGRSVSPADHPRPSAAGPVIRVVAAENFWGSLVSQLGGNDTSVLSIVSDPNADPHEYEANTSDATAIANAQFVIVNGVGYDTWALNLIAAASTTGQVVLNVGDLNGVVVGGGIVSGNPHMWYNPVFVNRTVAAMYSDLVEIAPGDTADFQANYATLNVSLASLYGEAGVIKAKFAGTTVASTESIFVYLANYTGLNLISPPEFMQAVAEGNDPPADTVVTFQCQLESGKVSVLIYNEQTVTPLTSNMKTIAVENNVTVVGVTETIQPPGTSFEVWMNAQYLQLENALNAKALSQ
ncbi:MAG TPA: zinc ABC transporter substrate-binding protein [Thermoplasmata archaeon]|nr:zinc ABC transporter substrate-binding protein [Thermoplasmata archaeon]